MRSVYFAPKHDEMLVRRASDVSGLQRGVLSSSRGAGDATFALDSRVLLPAVTSLTRVRQTTLRLKMPRERRSVEQS